MTPSRNPFVALLDLLRSPIDCFAAIYERPKWAFIPYLIVILSPLFVWFSYFDNVDMAWLQQTLMAQLSNSGQLIEQEWLTQDVLIAGEISSDIFGRTVCIFVLALWLNLSTKGNSYKHSYGKWLAASCFIMLPTLVGDIASLTNILFNSNNIMPNTADLNSLNGLLKLPLNHPWAPFATAVPLLAPWYIALTYTSVAAWTDFDRAKAIIVATLPWLLILTIWPIMILVA